MNKEDIENLKVAELCLIQLLGYLNTPGRNKIRTDGLVALDKIQAILKRNGESVLDNS